MVCQNGVPVYPGLHPGLVCGAPLGRWLTGHIFETNRPKSSCGLEARAPNRVAPVFLTIQLTHTKPGSPSKATEDQDLVIPRQTNVAIAALLLALTLII